jgi:hypothetical protein
MALAMARPDLNLTQDEWARLENGELILKIEEFECEKGVRGARTVTFRIVNATPDEVWKVLYEPEKDFEWAPRIATSQVTNKEGNCIDIYYIMSTPFIPIQFHIRRIYEKDNWLIESSLIENEENSLEAVDGQYALYPHHAGKKTIIKYSLYLVVSNKTPMVIQQYFTKRGCKEWMENLKKRVESTGTWKKE